nr:unnamed protein product [Spirometra erinaceieuropaei]
MVSVHENNLWLGNPGHRFNGRSRENVQQTLRGHLNAPPPCNHSLSHWDTIPRQMQHTLTGHHGTLLTEKTQILQRWAEHFRGVLNHHSAIPEVAVERLPQVQTNEDLDLPPSLQETIRAVQQLSSGKAPGSDAIPAEVYKHGGPQLMDHLTALFQEMWRQGEVPHDFKDANIVPLYKRKGNRQVCDNHRGISLLNIGGKIFARILLNRLNNHLEQGLLPESQCGFRRHRGTTDMIFAARQLQEKCREMRTHLYSTFVDLTKAFDTVNREGLWKIMQKFGCPERFTQMVRQLHDGMMARVTDNGAVSEAFAVTNGVEQGCVLAPTLFSLMFSAMLMDAYRDERPGIRIAYRTDACIHSHRARTPLRRRQRPEHHLRSGDATEHGPILRRLRELWAGYQHTEDGGDAPTATQLSHSPQRAANQREWDSFASGRELPVPGQDALPQQQDRRRSRQQDLENQSSLRSPPKHSLESPRTQTQHLYSSHPEAELEGRIRYTDVLERTGILSIYTMLRQTQLRWSGHLVRMYDERLPKRPFYGVVATGSRRQEDRIRRYKDTMKSSLKRVQINMANWEDLARDRPTWRRTVKTGAEIYEANHIAVAKVKREGQSASKTHNRFQHVLDVNGHSGLEKDLLDTFGSTALLEPHQPSSPRPPLPPRHRQLILTILLNHHFHPPPRPPLPPPPPPPPPPLLQRRPLRRLSRAQRPTLPPPPPNPVMRIRTTPALTATAHSPHTSAWSVTCESIAQ